MGPSHKWSVMPTAWNTHCLQKQCPHDSPTGSHIGACTQTEEAISEVLSQNTASNTPASTEC